MFVYFVRAGEAGPVKIGASSNVSARLRTLQISNFVELKVLRVLPGTKSTESWLHYHYKDRRIKGEWYEFSECMLTLIPPDDVDIPLRVRNIKVASERVDTHVAIEDADAYTFAPGLSRAARGALRWSLRHAEKQIGVSCNTIKGYEDCKSVRRETIALIKRAYENAGVDFLLTEKTALISYRGRSVQFPIELVLA